MHMTRYYHSQSLFDSNCSKLSMMGPQLFSGWYQMILDVFRCFQLGCNYDVMCFQMFSAVFRCSQDVLNWSQIFYGDSSISDGLVFRNISFLGLRFLLRQFGIKAIFKNFSASFPRLTGNFWWCMLGTIRLNFWICGLKDFLRCFVDNAFF